MPENAVKYRNAEDLDVGDPCPNYLDGCGGRLRESPFCEGLYCEVCETEWRGR